MFRIPCVSAFLVLPLVGACAGESSGGGPSTDEGLTSTSAPSESNSGGETHGASFSEPTSLDETSSASSSSPASTTPVIAGTTRVGTRCERDSRIGALNLMWGSDRTIVAGSVSNGVMPSAIPAVRAEADGCQLLTPRNSFCSSCASDEVCAGDEVCVPKPSKVSAGVLRVEGLLTDVEVAPNAITFDYSKTILDPFPAFDVGDPIEFHAAGDDLPAFEAKVEGVPKLSSDVGVVTVGRERGATLTWETAVEPEESAIFVSFSVNVHGAVTGWIECTVDDDGEFEVPEVLVTELIDMGLSGFPRVDLERRSSATVEIEDGCIDVYAGSKITLDIEVDGLTSCNTDDDCDAGQTCSDELACE